MKFIGYEEKYKQDLLVCLKRNVIRFNRFTDEELYQWMRLILDYPWIDSIDQERYPYRRGVLLLDDNGRVSGFSGAIYSKQRIGGRELTVVNTSISLTDSCYKYYFFEMYDRIVNSADVTYVVTPNENSVVTTRTLYNAAIIDNPSYLFKPAAVSTKGFQFSGNIRDDHSTVVMRDHEGCGLECVHIEGKGDGTDVFFNHISEVGHRPMNAVCVLEVSNPAFFRRYFAVCACLLSNYGQEYLTTDSRYVDPVQLPEQYETYPWRRAIVRSPAPEAYSFLYTEFVLLTRDCYW
jgi:hypothetical protein